MTTKYKFTDKSLGLGKRLTRDLSKFIDARNLECKHKQDSEYIMHLLISLEAAFSSILEYSRNNLNQSLDDILGRDYLTFTEALFILHGFYPSLCIDLKQDQESDDIDTYDHTFLLNYFEGESKTYTDLLSAIAAGKESNKHGIQSDSKDGVYIEQFIFWAIDKGFIEETGNKSDTGNIDTHYNQERNLIANHNKEVALEAYEAWIPALGASRNASAFVNDSIAWAKLELKLEPLLKEDDAGNRVMPREGVIAQYIRDDINSKKS